MYEPSKIIDSFFIAGFPYHDGADVLNSLEVGTKLDLVPEFDNPYDPNAIAIKFKGTHLGYVPRAKNALLAQLIFFGHANVVRCKVVQRNKSADPHEQVRVKLYFKDGRKRIGIEKAGV